jgi:hypothetical protein
MLVMRALEATALCLVVSSLACGRASRAHQPPADAGTMVTVYVPPKTADEIVSRLTGVAARHRWALSVRTDSAALGEADLIIVDSAGTLIGRLRPGAAAAVQARELADAVRR